MKAWGKIGIIVAILFAAFITIGIYSNREVVNAFGKINQKLEEINTKGILENESIVNNFKNDSLRLKVMLLQDTTKAFYAYIDSLKTRLLEPIGDDFEKGDKKFDLFFNEGHITQEGKYFLKSMQEVHLVFIKSISIEDTHILQDIDNFYPPAGIDAKEDGESWLRFHFEDFPAIATLVKYTSIQNDIQMIEKQILTAFVDRELQVTQ